jgi:glutathione S-transferase
MSDLILYAESQWVSPWVFHAMVALEEKRLPYRLELVPLPIPAAKRAELAAHAILWKVPILVDGDAWISESLAISEYLAERYPTPGHPRLFPADLVQRARARQVMLFVRTGLFALREARPTSTLFVAKHAKRPEIAPLSEAAATDAAEVIRVASALIAPGQANLFDHWCIADCDLSLLLMRLVANGDSLPAHLADYARAQWARPSAQKFLDNVR